MSIDAHKNFAYSTVATAPSPATSGTSLIVASGQGALFPVVPFNATVWPANTQPTSSNAEIVRVTNISSDTLTITRTQESTSARTIIVGDQIAATITAKSFTDIEEIQGGLATAFSGSGGVIATGSSIELIVPYTGILTDWVISSIDPSTRTALSGSIVIDIERSGTSIIGAGNNPALSSQSSNTASIASWTSASVTKGDRLVFYVVSATTVQQVSCIVYITKTA